MKLKTIDNLIEEVIGDDLKSHQVMILLGRILEMVVEYKKNQEKIK